MSAPRGSSPAYGPRRSIEEARHARDTIGRVLRLLTGGAEHENESP